MAKIGTFTKRNDGVYTGSMKTLAIDVNLEIVPVEATGERPNYKVYSAASEVGAGWDKISEEKGTGYISLKLDDPSLSAPIYASLLKAEGENEYSLLWQRPTPRS